MFIIDFDDTLFNTQAFKQARLEAVRALGISEELYWQTYKEAYNINGKNTYGNQSHAQALARCGFNENAVFAALEGTTKNLEQFLFLDTIVFLEKMKGLGEKMILLSLGEPSFIGLKVRGAGIEKYFDGVVIVDDKKANVLPSLWREAEGDAWLINDKIDESLRLRGLSPDLKILLKRSPRWSADEYARCGLPSFANLLDIYKHISAVAIVILAAGQGKRMQSDLPKVMHLLNGRPLVDYVVKVAEELEVKPAVVVSVKDNLVKNFLGNRADYAVQAEPLGTGHALMCVEKAFTGRSAAKPCHSGAKSPLTGGQRGGVGRHSPDVRRGNPVVVLYGDMPFIKSTSIKRLIDEHIQKDNVLTLMTVRVKNFDGWRASFADFGRVIRDADGKILRTVEKKDATPAELEIKELNPCYYCFKSEWIWPNLKKLKNNNAQGEYYLTDLVEMALREGARVSSIELDAEEAIGINTKEYLEIVNVKCKNQKSK